MDPRFTKVEKALLDALGLLRAGKVENLNLDVTTENGFIRASVSGGGEVVTCSNQPDGAVIYQFPKQD